MVLSTQVLPLAASVFFASVANAQVALYGQCGGQGYTGETSCVAGAVCQTQNDFYYQCVPGTATSPVAASSAAAVSSAAATLSTAPLVSASPVPSAGFPIPQNSSSTFVTSIVKAQATKAATGTGAASTGSSSASSGTKYLMIFGDSYSSDGFWAGGSPPSAAQPLGVSLPGTTTSGGLNWVGVTATELNTSLTLAFDFAEYGATTDNTLVNGATNDYVAQVKQFETYTANASDVDWTADNTMAIVWIGINDVGNKYWNSATITIDQFLDVYFQNLQKLYDAGIRYFTLFTVPPFDQAPVFAQQSNLDTLRGNITAYNEGLEERIASFKSSNTGVTGQVFNTSASFWTALNDPSTYGASDATCANADGTTCLWYDNYHPGQAIQKLVAQNFVKELTGTFF